MKKILCALLTLVMVLSLAACGGGSGGASSGGNGGSTPSEPADTSDVANDPKVTLVYAEVNPEDTIVGQTATEFKRLVEEKSGGSITIDVRYSGVLGSENDVLDAIVGGDDSIDMSRISAFALTSYGAEKSVLLSLPFTFESRDHWWNFANSDLAQEFLNEPQEIGLPLRGIFYGEEGFRHFFANRPINNINDLNGLKVRVSNDPIMNGMVESLGGSPTVVSFGELYSALNTGVCDVAEQPIANYKSNAFPEVANNLILDGHTLGAIQAVITDTAWAKLTPAQQTIIMEAGKEVQAFNQNLSQSAEDEVLQQLKDEGCNVVDVADKGPWQEACSSAPAIQEAIDKAPDLYQQILDMK
ncbi:MAG: TRAP transporter substrate-binding protein [Oscillibacter sp.]|nr:TRAP transporter substrate-binding protein [Oscillibacter sp.]